MIYQNKDHDLKPEIKIKYKIKAEIHTGSKTLNAKYKQLLIVQERPPDMRRDYDKSVC